MRPGHIAQAVVALLCVVLSGAPRMLALHAPVEGHRCSCRSHSAGRQCGCALCHRRTLAHHAPPCHGRAMEREVQVEGAPARPSPCIEGTCGSGTDRPVTGPGGVETFCPPLRTPATAVHPWIARHGGCRATFEGAEAREPETPPPRRLA
jgi:hypothetical protein